LLKSHTIRMWDSSAKKRVTELHHSLTKTPRTPNLNHNIHACTSGSKQCKNTYHMHMSHDHQKQV